MRDFTIRLPWLGVMEVGNSGFRFARIDLLDDSVELHIKEIRAISVFRDIPYKGSFRCNDERLNRIWQTGAYTVHLNMQEYIWDGIKRDRLVWIGDLHPEVMTVNTVFGYNEVIPKSLDFIRDGNAVAWLDERDVQLLHLVVADPARLVLLSGGLGLLEGTERLFGPVWLRLFESPKSVTTASRSSTEEDVSSIGRPVKIRLPSMPACKP